MNDLLTQLLSDNLSALKGLRLSGTVPVPQELLNDALAEVLRAAARGEIKAPTGGNGPKLDPQTFAPFVKQANITFKEGVALLEFDVRVE